MGEAAAKEQKGSADAPPVRISGQMTLQPPLSRRGRGPGLVLVLDHYAQKKVNLDRLDPPPTVKWAEEGFCVVEVSLPGKLEEDGEEFPLKRALEVLRECKDCEKDKGVALVSYLWRIPFYVEEQACLSKEVKAIVSYGGKKFSSINTAAETVPPQLLHFAGPPPQPQNPQRRTSVVPQPDYASLSSRNGPTEGTVKTFRYLDAKNETNWSLSADDDYHPASAGLAHTRSLKFIKDALDGPHFDLEALWDEHCKYEFGERDVEKTMATMVAEPYVNHIPTMTGGIGQESLTAFYTNHFVFSNPDDTALELVSRTVGVDRVIDEFVFKFTHDKEMPWLLPGVPPTNKQLAIPFTSVICFRGDRLCHEHISWDSGTAFNQLGILPEYVPFPYEIDGKKAAEKKRFEIKLPTVGVEGANKLVDEGSEKSNALIERGVVWREVDDV
ncbi:hypothetical protein BDV96DRAFT_488100 [Lophiotrema nucula]|uniref:SnoaL-like domain-containing protein n=1 Tax=Lophiotrema nucula TaxID=690887 RepID=A0A6A5ZJF5_9PLEO|nr:hypothetical protein BDV96DRAFT_488100 [Lophiotrema nucula]